MCPDWSGNELEYVFPRTGKKSDQKLMDIFNHTQRNLDIAIFNFTDKKILDAILRTRKRGVEIRIITDKTMAMTPKQFYFLQKMKQEGVLIKKNIHPGFMHLKMTISDQRIVTVASANFTVSSQIKNDDVFIVFRNEKIAGDFSEEFERMWTNIKEYTVF